jgi:hypothetical protein
MDKKKTKEKWYPERWESVYLVVEEPFSNKVKIGKTSGTTKSRLSELNTGNATKLKIYHDSWHMPFGGRYEKNLHEAFKDRHIRGEWFVMSEFELWCLQNEMMEDEECLVDCEYHGEETIKKILDGVKDYGKKLEDEWKEDEDENDEYSQQSFSF